MSGLNSLGDAIKLWTESGISMLPPRSEKEIRSALGRLPNACPEGAVCLYGVTGGMNGEEMAPGLFTLWSLERTVQENKSSNSELLLFADFLISSHCFGLHAEPSGSSSVYIEHFSGAPIWVADGLEPFFRKYVDRSPDLLLLWD